MYIFQKSSGSVSYPSRTATYSLSNGDGTLSVDRTAFASPPVTGKIDVEFNGNTKAGKNFIF